MAAGVAPALSDMTYGQILGAKSELQMSPEGRKVSARSQGHAERFRLPPPPTVIWLVLIGSLTSCYKEEQKEPKQGNEERRQDTRER